MRIQPRNEFECVFDDVCVDLCVFVCAIISFKPILGPIFKKLMFIHISPAASRGQQLMRIAERGCDSSILSRIFAVQDKDVTACLFIRLMFAISK